MCETRICETGKSNISDQRVVFLDHYPWDKWATEWPLNTVSELQEKPPGIPPTPSPKDCGPSVMIQSPRSRLIQLTQWSVKADLLVANQPAPILNKSLSPSSNRNSLRTRSLQPNIGFSAIPEPKKDSSTLCQDKWGFNMPTASALQTTPKGLTEFNKYHHDQMIKWLIGNVQEKLRQPYEFSKGFKQPIKPNSSNTKKYLGTPKFKDLENWLVIITNHFALSRLGGPEPAVNKLHVNFLQSWLESETLK